jgi:hypothetical protein
MRWLAAHRLRLRDAGCLLGVVYMGDNRKGADWLTAFGLMDVMRVHDPDRLLYAAFGMVRMSPSEIEGPATGAPGSKGRGAARGRYGDMLQLGGVVVLRNGACVHRHPQQRLTEGVDWSRVLRVLDTGPGDAKWGRPAVVSPGGGRE